MTFQDVIAENCKRYSPKYAWWPKYAYHFTDVQNTVSILSTGKIYCRNTAEQLHLMKNENASRQVIDMTRTDVKSYVRFYFRPLTPTQYYNEGFKHPLLRFNGEQYAHVSIPIFFVFDLAKMLELPELCFSGMSQAGGGSPINSGLDAFSKLDFSKIYSEGPFLDHDMVKYRQAELLYPGEFPLLPCLKMILCRNNAEKLTLLSLLNKQNPKLTQQYQYIIKVGLDGIFENNGLFVKETSFDTETSNFTITFSDTYQKKWYMQKMMNRNKQDTLTPLIARMEFEWLDREYTTMIHSETITSEIEYDIKSLSIKLPSIGHAGWLRIHFYLEDILMCYLRHSIDQTLLW